MISRRRFLLYSGLLTSPKLAASLIGVPLVLSTDRDAAQAESATDQHADLSLNRHHAIPIKEGEIFLLCEPDGTIPEDGSHGHGLFYHDCRYLSAYDVTLADKPLRPFGADASDGYGMRLVLTNEPFTMDTGQAIDTGHVLVEWSRVLDGTAPALHERFHIRNVGSQEVACILHLSLESKFEPLYGVRGKIPSDLGTPKLPQWEKDTLWFRYAGTDRLFRALAITMMPAPHGKEKTSARYAVRLAPNESQQIDLTFRIREEPEAANIAVSNHTAPPFAEVLSRRRSDRTNWERTVTIPHCDNPIVNQTLRRCLDDVRMLTMTMEGQRVMAAGIPWFVGLFGRDSLIASLELQAFAPALSAGDLRLLARYQGQKNTGPPSDEQPGKILHELRVGEGARSHHIPHTPYYGSIDSTLWYVIALVRYVDWTGDVDLFHELRPHLEAALTWMDLFGDRHGEDFVSYSSDPADQLANKGWKDSSEAIVNADGSQAHPPIALVAAQGYIYHGKQLVAALYDRIGERAVAERMRRESARLRERFNAAFWIPAINFYALALQQHQKPAAVVSSNPGQALWTGIVDEDKAKQVASRVMEPDMFTGWGIRTLSSLERGYSPISYERGSVWPFDTAFIGAGLRRYGFDEAACRLFDGLVAAASYFDWYRLPELFCGFSREEYHVPIPNPKAEHPQAWSAGSVPYLLTELLGFRPSALDHRLDLVRPVLPASIQRLEFGRLRVGAAHVDLSFTRRSDGRADVKVAKVDGSLDVQVTP